MLFQFDMTFTLESYGNDFEIWRFYKGESRGRSMFVLLILLPEGSHNMHRTHRLRWDLKMKDVTFLEAGNELVCHMVINSLSAAVLYTEPR